MFVVAVAAEQFGLFHEIWKESQIGEMTHKGERVPLRQVRTFLSSLVFVGVNNGGNKLSPSLLLLLLSSRFPIHLGRQIGWRRKERGGLTNKQASGEVCPNEGRNDGKETDLGGTTTMGIICQRPTATAANTQWAQKKS